MMQPCRAVHSVLEFVGVLVCAVASSGQGESHTLIFFFLGSAGVPSGVASPTHRCALYHTGCPSERGKERER